MNNISYCFVWHLKPPNGSIAIFKREREGAVYLLFRWDRKVVELLGIICLAKLRFVDVEYVEGLWIILQILKQAPRLRTCI